MKIAITAESTIDLPKELLEKFDIKTIPFDVILGEDIYKDGEISAEDIFKFVDEKKVLPKTSAINQEDYKEFFTNILKDYDAIIHFALSSEISSTCSHAVMAAKELNNCYIVDSRSLSTGIALLAINARNLANTAMDPKAIYEESKKRTADVQASFVIKKLDYLYKGGRCSSLSYFAASVLKIKPEIVLKDGKMQVGKKYFGKTNKVISSYCKDVLNENPNPELENVFITYSSATEDMVEAAKKELSVFNFKNVYCTNAGATITSHCGENTLGILFLNNPKE